MTSRLYWIGQYEGVKKLEWFFKFDLARPIVDCAKRVFGEVLMAVMTPRLYWVSQYEGVKKFFKLDLTRLIVNYAKRVPGEGKHIASFKLCHVALLTGNERTYSEGSAVLL